MKKYLPSLFFALALLLIPVTTARADMGPKPEMTFTFIDEKGNDNTLRVESGILYECKEADCSNAAPLAEMGPQRFECEEFSCYSMAYGYADYFYLEITFADGTARKSNIFEKKSYSAIYHVTLKADNTLDVVEENQTKYSVFPLISTLFIELLLAYLWARKKEISLKRFLFGILIANLLTHPVFAFLMISNEGLFLPFLVILALFSEMIAILVEGIFIYFFMKKEIGFWKSLLLSFNFNLASAIIGLFLPL